MATGTAVVMAPSRSLEDPLAHLPRTNVVEYLKGQTIYGQHQPSGAVYLVIGGKVKVSRLAGDGRQVVVDIYRPDDLFGESALLDAPPRSDQAVAMEDTRLMSWSSAEIEVAIAKRPRLGMALLQILVQRTGDLARRVESLSVDNIARRLARSLLRFAERLGTLGQDGMVSMAPFTHELLAQYVGTSREIVTHYMSQFRRQGLLRYSRAGIAINRAALTAWLDDGRQ
ncbi:MAG: Crp/Fnr family transcriptional regulator [Bryobacteraceae bacterium]